MNYKLRDQIPLFVFVFILFLLGVFFGALMVNQLTLGQKQDLAAYLTHFFQQFIPAQSADKHSLWINTVISNLKWIGLIAVLGLSVIGLPLVLILNFLKGALLGFTIRYLIDRLAWKGLIFTFLSIVPHHLLFLPAMFLMSVVAISYAMFVIKVRKLTPMIWNLARTAFFMAAISVLAAAFESFITPRLITLITPWLLAN